MKRFTFLILLALPAFAIAGSVPGLEGRPGPDQQVAHLDEALDLDDNQAAALLQILTDVRVHGEQVKERIKAQFDVLRQARESGNDKAMKVALRDMDDLKAEAQALRQDTQLAMRAELSLTQQVLLEEAEIERHQRMRQGMERLRSERDRRRAE